MILPFKAVKPAFLVSEKIGNFSINSGKKQRENHYLPFYVVWRNCARYPIFQHQWLTGSPMPQLPTGCTWMHMVRSDQLVQVTVDSTIWGRRRGPIHVSCSRWKNHYFKLRVTGNVSYYYYLTRGGIPPLGVAWPTGETGTKAPSSST